ncbi:MAG: carbohydrate ABC transporter permease [Armatimonadota bacterium]
MGRAVARKRDWGEAGFIAALLAPGLLLYGLLVLWPMVQSFYVSLHRWRGLSGNMVFVWFENYQFLLQDERFRAALWHNFVFFVMVAVSTLVLALFFANAMSQNLRGAEFFRAVFLFPNVVSIVAVSTLWMFLYNPQWGLINDSLELLGLADPKDPKIWLAKPETVLPSLAVTYVWYVLGFYVLLFRAGIQSISAEVSEAAQIDGATGTQQFWLVTLPLLNDIVRLAVIYLLINCFNLFALVWIMAPPSGTANESEVALTYLYQKGFVEQQFGYSTAIGTVNFVVVMAVTLLLQRLWKTGK